MKILIVLRNTAYIQSSPIVVTKKREIYRLPYYPDRIVHHAIMNVIEPYLVSRFTADTFNCLKGRGIHYGVKRLKRDLKS